MARPIVSGSTQHNRITQLIRGDGTFDAIGLGNFINMIKLGQCGLSYAVVSIMGPQSSGKSTLLNHLFGTNFALMDASRGRPKTTNGVWLSNAVGIEPLTIVMDLEGNDGRERGEDVAFEKQIALFALAVSDVMLINMWSTDVGREQGANKPLLRTIFKVYMKLFRPGRKTLVFVIRDKDKVQSSVESLEAIITEDVRMIWDAVHQSKKHKKNPLSEFFNVRFVGLPCPLPVDREFNREVDSLRQLLRRYITWTWGEDTAVQRRVPASGFLLSWQEIWKTIQENKDLDIPKLMDLVANKHCQDIADEVYSAFKTSEEWHQMNDLLQSGRVPAFGKKLLTMMQMSLERYDSETTDFDERIRSTKGEQLVERLRVLIAPALEKLLERIKRGALNKFREEMAEAVSKRGSWDWAAQSCSRLLMIQIKTELEEAGIKLSESEISELSKELQIYIDADINALRRGLPTPEIIEPKNTFKESSEWARLFMSICVSTVQIVGAVVGMSSN